MNTNFNVPRHVVDEMVSRGAKLVGVNDDTGVHVHFFSEPMVEVGYFTRILETHLFMGGRKWHREFYDELFVKRLDPPTA